MVKFHFFRTHRLASELSRGDPSEKTGRRRGPAIADPSIFADPMRPLILIDFVWAPAITAIIFWRLNVHLGRLNATPPG